MNKAVLLIVVLIFVVFLGIFLTKQLPVAITQDEVLAAIDDAIAESQAHVDEREVNKVVNKSIEKLEARQKRRLKFLVSAYFIIWLIFSLYALRTAQAQSRLRQRFDQLETHIKPLE